MAADAVSSGRASIESQRHPAGVACTLEGAEYLTPSGWADPTAAARPDAWPYGVMIAATQGHVTCHS